RERETDGLWRVDLGVPKSEEDVPSSPAGRAFLGLAKQERTLASLMPPIWSRRRSRRTADTSPDDELEQLQDELDEWLRHRGER
ncbi:MAG: hypothetical protein ACOCT8_03635, partial [Actinomycetota bacterium]